MDKISAAMEAGTFDAGTKLSDILGKEGTAEWVAAMNEMAAATQMSVADMNEMLAGLHMDAEVSEQEVEVT
jgi:hypothetical protein